MPSTVRPSRNYNPAPRVVPLKRARFWLVCLFFFVWALLITFRLFWLQVVHHRDYLERAQHQQQHIYEVAPSRGVLYDRNLRELAMTVKVDTICAETSKIIDKPATAHLLAQAIHTDPTDAETSEEQIAARLQSGRRYVQVARRVTPDISARVQAMIDAKTVSGIYFVKESQRFYPDNEIAAQVLGYVGMDDNGLGGLEQKFEPQLHGASGQVEANVDALRNRFGSTVNQEPKAGRNLVLTIDENIQFMAERALDHAMERTLAANGTVVVQDVHTGQILALAIRPTFNPNQFRRATPELLRNHAVSDVYEPGSVFKLVTYSAALEQGVTKPDDKIDCQGGQINLFGRIIHDDKGEHFGVITVHEALEHSSDVAAVKLAMKVGQDHFYQFVRDFGFGQRTGAELPGETRGLLRPVNRWSATSIGSIAIGQEIGVTPIQLISMISTIANGGVYLPPRVLMPGQVDATANGKTSAAPQAPPQVTPMPFKPGGELPDPLPPGAHRVLSTMTAAQMRKMMEGVVLYGTGKRAQLNGYSSGGKTGTAQKIDPATHLYSKSMHIASFVGIAPVNNPVIAVAVVMDNPKGGAYHGADVSAPVFAEVAQQVLEYLAVPHDIDLRQHRALSKADLQVVEDDAHAQTADINALYAAANDLPSDDPLRGGSPEALRGGGSDALRGGSDSSAAAASASKNSSQPAAASQSQTGAQPANAAANAAQDKVIPPQPVVMHPLAESQPATATVIVASDKTLRVPSLIGLPVRKVIEQSAASGLEVQITGSGTVREQAPAAGTMVAPGTKIVVRCGRP
jgi:cell division protein FtsI (penicillin-binding protein 3)